MGFGSAILCGTLSLFGVRYRIWEPILAMVVGFLCAVLLPRNVSGLLGFVAMILVLKYTTREEWADLFYAVSVARFALVPIMLMAGLTWNT